MSRVRPKIATAAWHLLPAPLRRKLRGETGKRFRIGGLVKQGSLVREGLTARFEVTDGGASFPVIYRGLLPDLFREQQGVVAEGAFDAAGTFRADTVLAKHDERYMPKEVADALKKQGVWREESAARK